jgi:hypothetical protein
MIGWSTLQRAHCSPRRTEDAAKYASAHLSPADTERDRPLAQASLGKTSRACNGLMQQARGKPR